MFSWSLSARAQYSIDWFTVDGGGTSAGGVYSVSGTIGQTDPGTLSGGSYTLAGGFWGIVSAVQSPGAPLLYIKRTGGEVRVFRPKPSAGFVLDQSLTVTGAWSQPRLGDGRRKTRLPQSRVLPPLVRRIDSRPFAFIRG